MKIERVFQIARQAYQYGKIKIIPNFRNAVIQRRTRYRQDRIFYPLIAIVHNTETGRDFTHNFGEISPPIWKTFLREGEPDYRIYVVEGFNAVFSHSVQYSNDYMEGRVHSDDTKLSNLVYEASVKAQKIGIAPGEFWWALEQFDYESVEKAWAKYLGFPEERQ